MKMDIRNWLVMARKIAEMPLTQSSRTIFCTVFGDIEIERRVAEKSGVTRKEILVLNYDPLCGNVQAINRFILPLIALPLPRRANGCGWNIPQYSPTIFFSQTRISWGAGTRPAHFTSPPMARAGVDDTLFAARA